MWAAKSSVSWRRRHGASEIFKILAVPFDDDVVRILDEILAKGIIELVGTVGDFLEQAPPSFVYDHSEFVGRALRVGSQLGPEVFRRVRDGLYSSAISGERMTVSGKPFPQDIDQRDRSAALTRTLASGSVEAEFYKMLYDSALHSLKLHQQQDDQMADFRSW